MPALHAVLCCVTGLWIEVSCVAAAASEIVHMACMHGVWLQVAQNMHVRLWPCSRGLSFAPCAAPCVGDQSPGVDARVCHSAAVGHANVSLLWSASPWSGIQQHEANKQQLAIIRASPLSAAT